MASWKALAVLLPLTLVLSGCMNAPGPSGPADGMSGPQDSWEEPLPAAVGCTDVATRPLQDARPLVRMTTSVGVLEMEVYRELVPRLADHFLALAESGAYDGESVHWALRDAYLRAGNMTDVEPVAEEYHHRLRPDGPGRVAFWRDVAGEVHGELVMTFDAYADLEERSSVFAQVLPGSLGVLEEIGSVAASATGEPTGEVVIESTEVVPAPEGEAGPVALGMWTPRSNVRVPSHGGTAGFLVSVMNCAARVVDVRLTAEAPEGVEVHLPDDAASFSLAALQRRAVPVEVDVPAGAGTAETTLVLRADGAQAAGVQLAVVEDPRLIGRLVEEDDHVRSWWLLMSEDGRVVATNYETAAGGEGAPHWPGFNGTGRGAPYAFQPSGPAPWPFWGAAALGAEEGSVVVIRIAPEMHFGYDRGHPLAGRELFFLLDMLGGTRA